MTGERNCYGLKSDGTGPKKYKGPMESHMDTKFQETNVDLNSFKDVVCIKVS